MSIFKNVNSTIYLPSDIQFNCISDTWTFPFTHDVQIYLVCPDTMDKIAPPDRTKGLDPRCKERIKRILDDEFIRIIYEVADNSSKIERVLEDKYTILKECTTTFHVDGVFIAKDLCVDLPKNVETPAIFICPERIYKNAKNISSQLGISIDVVFSTLLRSTVIHEQNHAFTWEKSNGESYNRYNEAHIRILEEFSAQITAYSHLNELGKIVFIEKSKDQPIEYNTWKIITTFSDRSLSQKIAFLFADLYRGKLLKLYYEYRPLMPRTLLGLPLKVRICYSILYRMIRNNVKLDSILKTLSLLIISLL